MKRAPTSDGLTMSLGIAALVTLAATVLLGLTLPKTVEQAEYSRLIAIHPGIAWTAYVAASVTALASILWLWPRTRHPRWDLLAGSSAEIATLFTALKWVGAGYLIYLGVKLWRAPVAEHVEDLVVPVERHGRIFLHAYAVTALNPKSIVFFIAFLPQFLERSGSVPSQLLICEITFLVLATLNALAYALLASAARRTIRRPGVQRAVNRAGGGLLIGAGTLAVAWRR